MTDQLASQERDRPAPPWIPEVGVLALVPDRWREIWAVRHHMLTRLARYFTVLWMSPAHNPRDVIRRWREGWPPLRHPIEPEAFTVYTPEPWLPYFHKPSALANLTFRHRLRRARAALVETGCRKIVLYLWRPTFAGALAAVPHDLSCYHIDDEYSFSPIELPPDPREVSLLEQVDQVFVHSPGLVEKKGRINPNTLFVPLGVDYQAYAQPAPVPADLTAIPRPRIGYVGGIKRMLDWQLLLNLSERHPHWSFILMGPHKEHPEIEQPLRELSQRQNVFVLPGKPTGEAAAYAQHFDACIMPYVADGYTKYIYPLKLHEYLASGQPVVGTRIRTLEDFAEVVGLASTPEEWSAALARALDPAESTPERRAQRQMVARDHDWNVLVDRVARAMISRLDPRLAERITPPVGDGERRHQPVA